jgi:uncharacterized protein YifN (PemK superfamily)
MKKYMSNKPCPYSSINTGNLVKDSLFSDELFRWALSDVCTVELYRMSRMSQRAQRAADKSKVKKRNTNKQISDLARILRAVCQRAE